MPRYSLQEWPAGIAERRAYVDPIFKNIATRYDFMTRALSFGQEQRWKRAAVALIASESDPDGALDLATGTGDFPLHLRAAGLETRIVGLDRNRGMLAMGSQKCARLEGVEFIAGDLMQIPFKDQSFDVVTMGYGLRYVADIRQTLREVFRLLRPGGTFVCLEFGIPKSALLRRVSFGYLILLGTLWGLILHGNATTYWHIVESLKAYPGQRTVRAWLEGSGFSEIKLLEKWGGLITIFSTTRP